MDLLFSKMGKMRSVGIARVIFLVIQVLMFCLLGNTKIKNIKKNLKY
jgi:hypothetical protein